MKIYPLNLAFARVLRDRLKMHKSIDEVWPSVENLRLKATRFFSLLYPTHVSIVISDIIQK